MIPSIIFYFFAGLSLLASIMVISSRNPVYSVLWLIFTFFNSAALLLLIGAEMVSMLLVIVYVGAVAVLFLFVVMMLNVKREAKKGNFAPYLITGLCLGFILLAEFLLIFFHMKDWQGSSSYPYEKFSSADLAYPAGIYEDINKTSGGGSEASTTTLVAPASPTSEINPEAPALTNTEAIGAEIYTVYFIPFQLAGIVLLIAMIGAIVLTNRAKHADKRQDIERQLTRQARKTIEVIEVSSGRGI